MSIVKNAVWYVEANKSRDIALSDIARSCGVTPFHLARVFRGQTGLSVIAYLRARRLSEAAVELARGDVGILTVALNAQYGSHEAFSRAFAEHSGLPPNQFAKIAM
jgi:AraC family transcriptional regulator